jgi:hypothetical protein
VDALVGMQLRSHDDLDVVVDIQDVPALRDALHGAGYTLQDGDLPLSFMVVDPAGRQVDVHPVTFDDEGNGLYHAGYELGEKDHREIRVLKERRCRSAGRLRAAVVNFSTRPAD